MCLAQSIHVRAGFATLNRKQDLSLWEQKNLALAWAWGSTDLGFDPSSSFTYQVTSDKLQPFLGCKTVSTILRLLHLVFVSEAHALSQRASAGLCSSKGLLGAWPILHGDSHCRWAGLAELPLPRLSSTKRESRWTHLNLHITVRLFRSDDKPLLFFFLLSPISWFFSSSPFYFYA